MEHSPLLLALFERRSEDAAALLAQRGDDLNALEAAATGRTDVLERHLEADRAGVFAARTPEGFDAIGLAAFLGGAGAVAMLLQHGADPEGDRGNELGVRPVHAAAAARDAAAMHLLLAAGADPDSPQRGGIVPLHAAALHDDVETVRVLLEYGADPGRKADDGRDALAFAAEGGATGTPPLLRAAV
jgi:ankyrin repeat protein